MKVVGLDHLVLTVSDIEQSVAFYTQILGMTHMIFGHHRHALRFGQQKINLHHQDNPVLPNAKHATTGSADLCLLVDGDLKAWLKFLHQRQIPIIDGIVTRTGAVGTIQSIYIQDPDGNLIELSQYDTDDEH